MATKGKIKIASGNLVQGGALFAGYERAQHHAPVETLFGPMPGQARLAGNENPFGPSPRAVRAIAGTAAKGCYYADRAVFELGSMIAERHGLSFGQVVLGAGATEILCAAALSWGQHGAILCPELFWDASINYARRKGVRCIRVPLAADMGIDLEATAEHLDETVSMVHLVNPNNPTGMALDTIALRAFAAKVTACGATLLVDEAYNELTDHPEQNALAGLVRAGENVVVCRTFSKIYGMAGLRVGYALASEENAARIRQYMTSFGGNVAGLAAAIASYDDQAFLKDSLASIREGRAMILDAVARAGLTALPSQANFVFAKVPDADAVQKAMAERNILIRGSFGPAWPQYSRVSVGRPQDVERYAQALPEIISDLSSAQPV